jgi:hypothetical protein
MYMTYNYAGNKIPYVTSSSTFDAVIAGERTVTTLYNHIDYWVGAEVWDHIVFEEPNKI